jgi:hypothetical protein
MTSSVIAGGITVFVFAAHISVAQVSDDVDGQIVYRNKTATVRFRIPVVDNQVKIEGLQDKVWYFDKSGDMKKLRPKAATEIRIDWNGHEIRMISRRPKHHTRTKKFVYLAVDGNVRLFEYVKTYRNRAPAPQSYGSGPGSEWNTRHRRYVVQSSTAVYWFLQRNNEENLVVPRTTGFRKQMKNYFDDCQQLTYMIDEKVFRRKDMVDIALFYNNRCR